MAKDSQDNQTIELAGVNATVETMGQDEINATNETNATNATLDAAIFEIDTADLDAFEDAVAKRIAWSDAVELVQEALEDWVEAQYDLAGLCEEEDAESIKRLTTETMKAWSRILQG